MARAEYNRMSIQRTGMDAQVSNTLTVRTNKQGVMQTISGLNVLIISNVKQSQKLGQIQPYDLKGSP